MPNICAAAGKPWWAVPAAAAFIILEGVAHPSESSDVTIQLCGMADLASNYVKGKDKHFFTAGFTLMNE